MYNASAPTHRPLRLAAATAIVAVLGAFGVAGPLAMSASADTVVVDNVAAFTAAVTGATEDRTISIEGDLVFDGSNDSVVVNDDVSITIEGNGHEVSCADDTCDRWLTVTLSDEQTLQISDLLIAGFRHTALQATYTNVVIEDVTFIANGYSDENAEDVSTYGAALHVYNYDDPDWTWSTTLTNVDFIENAVFAASGEVYGGAAYVVGPLSIDGGSFVGNYVGLDEAGTVNGAALAHQYGEIDVFGTVFEDNYVYGDDGRGGAIYSESAWGDFTNATFDDNFAVYGGAVEVVEGELSFIDTEFVANDAGEYGGALNLDQYSSLGVLGGEFRDNSAYTGGAIRMFGAYAEISDVTFRGNSSSQGGGAIYVGGDEIESWYSEAWVWRSLFVDNQATSGGALGVYNGSYASLNSSTLTDNTAYDGAALSSTFSTVDFSHVTIADNVPDNEFDEGNGGGQLWLQAAELSFEATVIVGAGDNRVNCFESISSSIDSLAANRADDATCELDDAASYQGEDFDAQLGPLRFNGGPTWTMLPDPESPLIDAWSIGGQDGCDDGIDDQRRVSRPQGDACDIGAVESFEPILWEVATPSGTVYFRIQNARDMADQPAHFPQSDFTDPAPPAGVIFPYGAFGLVIDVYDDGWPAFVEIATPTPTNQLWKLTPDGWAQFPGERNGVIWSFTLIDGGAGDNDGSEDATITDPVGPALVASFAG